MADRIIHIADAGSGESVPVRAKDNGDNTYSLANAVAGLITDRSGTIAAGGVAQATTAVANLARRYLEVQNPSTPGGSSFWISFTGTAVQASPSIEIPVGVTRIWDAFVPTQAISVIGPTTGQPYTIKEGA